MFTRLVLTFEILTPLFMGDADQMPELRPPAFKGLLRYWYRAAHPAELALEADIFGAAAHPRYPSRGQAPFIISIEAPKVTSCTCSRFGIGQGKKSRYPGLSYLGYSFPLQDKNRKKGKIFRPKREGIEPGARFRISLLFPGTPDEKTRQGIVDAAWLLGHVGSGGSRVKRGFGAFALMDWKVEKTGGNISPSWPEMENRPLLNTLDSVEQWHIKFLDVFSSFQTSLVEEQDQKASFAHPHLRGDCRFVISCASHGKTDWAQCLDDMGQKMQEFRIKYPGDYEKVKAEFHGRRGLDHTPDRATFGLPLAFRYGDNMGPVFLPKSGDRHASLLSLRPVLINNRLHPLYLRLAGSVPGGKYPNDPKNEYSGSRMKKNKRKLFPVPDAANAMDAFLDHVIETEFKGVLINA